MNLKTTFAAIILAAGAGALLYYQQPAAEKLRLSTPTESPTKSDSAVVLAGITPKSITAITVLVPRQQPLVLVRNPASGQLESEGTWPLRTLELNNLVQTICSLETRFAPIPITDSTKLADYGLANDQSVITIRVLQGEKEHRLTLARPSRSDSDNPFLVPSYIRVNDAPEILRFSPETYASFDRSPEDYRRRQLFPAVERVKVTDTISSDLQAATTSLLNDTVAEIEVDGPKGGYTLSHPVRMPVPANLTDKNNAENAILASTLADTWVITQPVSDKADPEKLRKILAAIPDLWVEQFLVNPDSLVALSSILPTGIADSPLAGFARAGMAAKLLQEYQTAGPFLNRAGLLPASKPHRLLVRFNDNTERELWIGKISRTTTREEPGAPPMFPGAPPSPGRTVIENSYYAKLANNPLVFEIRGDHMEEIFFLDKPFDPMQPPPAPTGSAYTQLRDTNPLRFLPDQVANVTIQGPKQQLELRKTFGKDDAKVEANRNDRWDIVQPFAGLAETKQVDDLLNPLSSLSPTAENTVERSLLHTLTGGMGASDLAVLGLANPTRITITSRPISTVAQRTLLVGNTANGQTALQQPNSDRVLFVEESSTKPVLNDARAYRSLKLFDLTKARVEAMNVTLPKLKYQLQEQPGKETTWKIMAPVVAEADTARTKKLFEDIASVEATEYLGDPFTAQDKEAIVQALGVFGPAVRPALEPQYGFETPTAKVLLQFTGRGALPPQMVVIGAVRPGKEEYFARIENSANVFGMKKELVDQLTAGSLALLPTQLVKATPTDLSNIRIQPTAPPAYRLNQVGPSWNVTEPFQAVADFNVMNDITAALATLSADRFIAHNVGNPAEYGFDMPTLQVEFTVDERTGEGANAKSIISTRTLQIGKAVPEGAPGRYATFVGANQPVFVLSEANFTSLNKAAFDLLNKRVLTYFPPLVTSVELQKGKDSFTLQQMNNDWKPVGANFQVDRPTIQSVVQAGSNLQVARFVEYGANIPWAKYGLDDASNPIKVVLKLMDETHTITVGKVVENSTDRYIRVDDSPFVAVMSGANVNPFTLTKLDFADRTLLTFDPFDLSLISRTGAGGEVEISLVGSNWNIDKPAKLAADNQTLEELSNSLSKLRGEKVVDVEGKDLAKFGLDQPTASISLEILGRAGKVENKKIFLGKQVDPTKADSPRYVRVEGNPSIMELSASLSNKLVWEPIKFRDRTLGGFITADKVSVKRPGQDISFVRMEGNWKMTAPVAAELEADAFRELLDATGKLRAEEIVTENVTNLAPFGLDQPTTWTFINGDKTVLTVLLGGREKIDGKDGFRNYAMVPDKKMVVLLDMALSAKLRAEYRQRSLWETLDVAEANKIVVDTQEGPGSFTLQKSPFGWMDNKDPADKLNVKEITDFLDAFAGLKAQQIVEHDATGKAKLFGLEPPQQTITVSSNNGQKRTLLVGRLNTDKQVYVTTPDLKAIAVLSATDTRRIVRDRSSLSETPPPMPPKKVDPPAKKEPKKENPPAKTEPKIDQPKNENPPKAEPKKEIPPAKKDNKN
ncbi:MAG: DUF4340 domain-containing protein [Zavarzinella sp.]